MNKNQIIQKLKEIELIKNSPNADLKMKMTMFLNGYECEELLKDLLSRLLYDENKQKMINEYQPNFFGNPGLKCLDCGREDKLVGVIESKNDKKYICRNCLNIRQNQGQFVINNEKCL